MKNVSMMMFEFAKIKTVRNYYLACIIIIQGYIFIERKRLRIEFMMCIIRKYMKKESMIEHFKNRFGGKVSSLTLLPPLPTSLNLELNNSCNQKCFFCPFHGDYAKKKLKTYVMNSNKAKTILKNAYELGIGSKELGLYIAGEVLLYKDLADIILFGKKIGFPYIFLTTNGVLADLDTVKKLIDSGLDSIRFSINAPDAETYKIYHGTDHFEEVKKNVTNLCNYIKENNITLTTSISCVLTKETWNRKEEFRSLFSELVDEVAFLPMSLSRTVVNTTIKEKYSLPHVENALIDEEYICPILFNTMYINANSTVIPCCEAYDSEVAFGSTENGANLKEIWYNDLYKKHRAIFVNKCSDLGTICHNCQLRKGGLNNQIL